LHDVAEHEDTMSKSARQEMSTDFRVVEASWSEERTRAILESTATRFVVVRRWHGQTRLYYLYRREELLRRLPIGAPGELEQILSLHEYEAAVVVSGREPAPARGKQVIVSGGMPRGVILREETPPRRRSRAAPGHESLSPPAAEAAPPTAGASPLPPRPPEAPSLARQLRVELPARIATGGKASLLVSLIGAELRGGLTSAAFHRPAGTKIEILVRPSDNLRVEGLAEGILEVTDPQPDAPLLFRLIAGAEGPASVRVYAFCQGVSLVTLTVETTVAAAQPLEAAAPEPGASRMSARVEPTARMQPDLSLNIFEEGNELTFRLSSGDGEYYLKQFGPIKMVCNPQDYFRRFFGDIENLPLDTAEQRKVAQRRLEVKGANLFDELLPAELKAALWTRRDRIRSVQITSDEPWVPWEVCRLMRRTPGEATQEGPFFAEAFAVTRWLYGMGAPAEIRLGNMAVVVPGDSGLSQAAAEKQYLLSLANAGRKVSEVKASYGDLTAQMTSGGYDAWHFTGHARAEQGGNADLSSIELAGREPFRPEDLIGEVENMLLARPFVFLNACQSAQGGLSLTGIGGWARRFLGPGTSSQTAAAFVGSYWSVFDDAALIFARTLYQGLLSGEPIGQAARAARLAIRKQDDPTWLAYTVYADPHATVKERT
jgi:hypothetical protein